MTRVDPTPVRAAAPPRRTPAGPPRAVRAVLRRGNRVVQLILRTPVLHRMMSRRFLVISYAGARTGRRFATPVMYLHDGDALLVAGGAPFMRLRPAADGGVPVEDVVRARTRGLTVARLHLDGEAS